MSNLKLFDDDEFTTNDVIHHDDSTYQARLDGQWLDTVALRAGVSIARRKSTSYAETLVIADKLKNDILGRQYMLFQPEESEGAQKYREKARLLSKRKRDELLESSNKMIRYSEDETIVTALQAVNIDIDELRGLLRSDAHRNPHLQADLEKLERIHEELEQQEISSYDESAIILKDWNRGIDLPTFTQPQRYNYHDFALPGKRVMRIGFFHPQKAEIVTGVDLLYEYHHLGEKKVRLAAIQYKLPNDGRKSITIDEKMQGQLNRLSATFCGNQLCEGSLPGLSNNRRSYCLPCCCAFFRPTDRLQQFNTRLATSGYHVRMCDMDDICTFSNAGNKILVLDESRKHGISASVFEELFCTGKLGSRWLTYGQLKKFHDEYQIIKPYEHVSLHIQEVPV